MKPIFVFGLIICSTHSWVLETSDKEFIAGITKNITLECKYDNQDNGEPRIAEVFGVIIHKLHGSGPWETYAKVHNHFHDAVLGDGLGSGFSVRGHADRTLNSFLTLTWSQDDDAVSFPNVSGRYACEINGYAEDDTLVKVVTDPISIIRTQPSSEYLLSMFLEFKRQSEKNRKQYTDMFGQLQQLVQTLHHDTDTLKADINATKEKTERENTRERINSLIQLWHEKGRWPTGQYALLNTGGGCPNSATYLWTSGYIQFHSESTNGSNHDSHSQPSHLARPVFETIGENNFVYIRTCKHTTRTIGPPWPKGSYCIHRVGGFCPVGFEEAKLMLDSEDDHQINGDLYNAPDVHVHGTFADFVFCCRGDGAPTTPIPLPTDKPFYLYRYKGTCQNVESAQVSEEWLQIDTEDYSNLDQNLTLTYPDSRLNPTLFYLCYYTKL